MNQIKVVLSIFLVGTASHATLSNIQSIYIEDQDCPTCLRFQKIIDVGGPKLSRSVNSAISNLGRCSGEFKTGSCFVVEDPCIVMSSAHLLLTASRQIEFNDTYIEEPNGDLMFTKNINKYFFDESAFAKNPASKKMSFKDYRKGLFFMDFSKDRSGKLIENDAFIAEKLLYLNPGCDVAVLKMERKNGRCPGDGLAIASLPSSETYQLFLNGQSRQLSNEVPVPGSKKSQLKLAGYPSFDGKNVESYQYEGKSESYRVRPLTKQQDFANSFCELIEHKITTFEGNSGGPYFFTTAGATHLFPPPMQADNVQGPIGQNDVEEVNQGTLLNPSLNARILQRIESERTPGSADTSTKMK